MNQHEPRDIYRLDHHPRSTLKNIGLAAAALAVVGVSALAVGDGMSAADEPASTAAPAASSDAECGPLWDRIRMLDLPEASWDTAAIALGLTPRGAWISADGQVWEHLDGRTVEVARPRSASPTRDADCTAGVDANGTSGA